MLYPTCLKNYVTATKPKQKSITEKIWLLDYVVLYLCIVNHILLVAKHISRFVCVAAVL